MPLTPHFEVSQTEEQVLITVSVRTVRVTNVEVLLEDSTLHFYATPYMLKLHFAPYEFDSDQQGAVSAEYNPSAQTVKIPLKKAQKGVQWENLDLTARLLQPREIPSRWLHSVEDASDINTDGQGVDKEDQPLSPMDENENASSTSPFERVGYGFGNIFHNIFTDYCRGGLAQEMLQLPDPDNTPAMDRKDLRLGKEIDDFNAERIEQDLYIQEDYMYSMVMEFRPFWDTAPKSATSRHDGSKQSLIQQIDQDLSQELANVHLEPYSSSAVSFSEAERLSLSTIPYPLIPKAFFGEQEVSTLWIGLIDLLVPFCYDHLTTMGDPTVESAWTITILSSSLSWLDVPSSSVEDVVTATTRRMLIYPYWRNFDFCCHVWKNTISILRHGVRAVVKSLLATRDVLEKSESYYVGNKIFIDPYLYWIQHLESPQVPSALVNRLDSLFSNPQRVKQMLGLKLEEISVDVEQSNVDNHSSDDGNSASDSGDSSSEADTSSSSDDDDEEPSETNLAAKPELLDAEVGTNSSILNIISGTLPQTTEADVAETATQKVSLIQEL